jgi:purine-binding chemotaxis protein CheW
MTMASPVKDHAPHHLSLLFRVHGRLCALPLEHVVETMRPLPMDAVAGAPACVAGVSIIRGAAIPVVDVARLLTPSDDSGRIGPPVGSARFVTVRVTDRTVALAVDVVVGVRRLPPGALHALPLLLRDAGSDAVATIGTLDAELLLVLRAARLVPSDLSAEAAP